MKANIMPLPPPLTPRVGSNGQIFFYSLRGHVAYETGPRSAVGNVSGNRYESAADPGVASSISARSHTFVEIDHKIMSTVILLPSAESFKKDCCHKRKYVHEVLVNCLFKLAQEKVWLGELTVPP